MAVATRSRIRSWSFGFTLIELLLVLAILVVLGGMVLPSLGTFLADRTLARAGDQLRTEVMQARLSAMRSGRTYLLRANPQTHEVQVRPWVDANDMTETMDQTGGSSTLLSGGNVMAQSLQTVDVAAQTRKIDLGDNVQVAKVEVQQTARSAWVQSQLQNEMAEDWGPPLLFYPDGSTTTAAITILTEGVGQVVVVVRGLTGEVIVSQVLPVDESLVGTTAAVEGN